MSFIETTTMIIRFQKIHPPTHTTTTTCNLSVMDSIIEVLVVVCWCWLFVRVDAHRLLFLQVQVLVPPQVVEERVLL